MQNLVNLNILNCPRRSFYIFISILLFLFTLHTHAQLVPYHNYDSWIKNNSSGIGYAFTGDVLRRAALIHTVDIKNCTAEERGKGWGVLNKEKMDTFISVNRDKNNGKIIEHTLGEYQTHFYFFQADNAEKISATLAWKDPAENDLDLRIIYNGTVYFPLSLNADGSALHSKDNSSLPIEKIELPCTGMYEFTIQICAKKSSFSPPSYCLCVSGASFSKRETGKRRLAQKLQTESIARKTRVQQYVKEKNISRRQVSPDGRVRGIFDVVNGEPVFVEAYNKESAITVSTDKVLPGGTSGLNLTGTNLPGPMGIWDVDVVYVQHKEFGNRVIKGENGELSEHADHVAGTLVASGVNPQAKGMAPAAKLKSYGWDDDDQEMNTEASTGMIISNHSYGLNPHVYTARWDAIVCSNPYFCIVNAIGNAMMAPFHSIATYANSKNLVAVGAVDEMPDGWQGPDVPIYILSNKGPAPDGRIKPDIMACGHKVISTTHKPEEYK